MREIRVYIPEDLLESIDGRCEKLEMNRSEYLRTLVYLDNSVQRYQKLTKYANLTYNTINDIHSELGVYVTPIQEVSMLNIE